ncbi:MAG: HAMP domain-containing histidine kinase [Spirochaetes bacterium]|nr:HAMP domain-containing histidine kinase [Spirochaetota bacterium]
MNTIFFKTFTAFLTSLLIFIIIMGSILVLGFNTSYNKWKNEKLAIVKENLDKMFNELFKDNIAFNEMNMEYLKQLIYNILPQNMYFVLFDNNKSVIFDIKKIGRGRLQNFTDKKIKTTDFYPVKINNKTTAYYFFYSYSYSEDKSTENLIKSLRSTIILSFFISFVLAALFSIIISKKLSKETKTVAEGIDRIAHGNMDLMINEIGTKEISLIAESVKILSEKLKKEKNLRDQWALDIAHDLRTPITALKTQLEGMRDRVLDLSIERINKNLIEINKIDALINDLSELTKLESPEFKLKKEKIRIKQFFENIINSFQHILSEKKINYKFNSEIDYLSGDSNLLNRAFSNLIGNAFKFTEEKGNINLSINNNLTVEIFNSGSFIPKNEREIIFDRLYRGEKSRNSPGSGLGLTIAKKIIEMHGAKINVESNKETGTKFIVEFNKN